MPTLDAFLARHTLTPEAAAELRSMSAAWSAWASAPVAVSDAWDPDPSWSVPKAAATHARYELLGPLGEGGMGQVYRAQDRQLGRVVALKVLRPELNAVPEFLARFAQEAQATAQLTHPGVVPVYELGQLADGRRFFTMEVVEGRSLTQVFRDDALPLRRKVDFVRRACEAVAYAHSRGVLHRDVKPSNVMVGHFGQVRVLDWGLVHVRSSELVTEHHDALVTRAGQVTGTPAYMPPEQARGEPLDARADVYALGAVLYTLLHQQHPFHGVSANEVLSRLAQGRVPTVESGPAELQRLCAHALQADPADRPTDASALLQLLDAWLEDAHALARAQAHLDHAQSLQDDLEALRDRAAARRHAAEEAGGKLRSYSPLTDKLPIWALQDEAEALELQAQLAEVRYTQGIRAALGEADLDPAHQALADLYQRRHAEAELQRRPGEAARYLALLQAHDRGRHRDYLGGWGTLDLDSDPRGARAECFKYALRDRRLVPERVGDLGHTPLRGVRLDHGSYLILLHAPDRPTVRVPVRIERGGHWTNLPPAHHPRAGDPRVRMPAAGVIRPDEVFVAAGWTLTGAPTAKSGLPWRTLWIDDFAIHRTPVTNRAYIAYLDALVADGDEARALALAPRSMPHAGAPEGHLYYGRTPSGGFELVPDAEGDLWGMEWPAVFVSSAGAAAYCAWRAERDGVGWRLPLELEREKASRGVDGRRYSWGDHPEPLWSANGEGERGRPTPRDVGQRPQDCSPYGMLDACGNVRDPCQEGRQPDHPVVDRGWLRPPAHQEGWGAVRGGLWSANIQLCRTGHRSFYPREHRTALLGIRPARDVTDEVDSDD